MTLRRCLRCPVSYAAICGYWVRTGYCAATPPMPEAVARLLGERKPFLMVTDPPYGIELDSEWRDKAG